MAADGKPTLWHIGVSHYSEKVRWALAFKDVEHNRRAPLPGLHMVIALGLTRGAHRTFPVLELDGERIGDSSAIIAALEARYPEPPLYPADEDERRRALALEDYFDEQLGPHIRLLAWHELTKDRERMERFASNELPAALGRSRIAARQTAQSFVKLRYGVQSDESAQTARRHVLGALDRLEQELGERSYLVGDRFGVADLTAAALFYPLVLPPEAPRVLADPPEPFEDFRAPLAQRPGFLWVQEMYRRHRQPQVAAAAGVPL
jgi:glutathione S-transferase